MRPKPRWWTRMTCPHRNTMEPDSHGYAICADCGAVVPVVFTEYQFDQAMDAILKGDKKDREERG